MSLTSQQNYNLLLSILSNHPLVKINSELLKQQLYNEIIDMERNKNTYNNSLLKMNKKIIYNMTQFNPLTSVKIPQKEKVVNFDLKLQEQQNEFNNYNIKTKPPEIDFSDNLEDPKTLTLDETLKQREEDFKNILKKNKMKIENNNVLKTNKIQEPIEEVIEEVIEEPIKESNNVDDTNNIIIENQNKILENQKQILLLLKNNN